MSYASLMTFLDGGPADGPRASVAASLAARFEASLTGVFSEPPLPLSAWDEPVYWGLPPVTPPAVPPQVLAEHSRRTEARAEKARMAFEAVAGAAGCRSEWLRLPADDGTEALSLMRRTDLAILPSRRLPTVGAGGSDPADLALASGGPALILPEHGGAPMPGRKVVVGWNGGREAARAVRDAWPFLQHAETVHVIVVAPADDNAPDSRLQRYFEAHGCTARIIVVRDSDVAAAVVLRDQIESLEADLLVMGLYGHSRLRETVFGGASRMLLRDSPVALLVSH